MAQIFICYSRADGQFVDEFVPFLKRAFRQDEIWYDYEIHGGADWWQMILEEIAQSDLFIYLLSNDSLTSPYCQAEVREAMRLNKAFLPIMIRPKTNVDNAPAELVRVIRRTNWIDFTHGMGDAPANASLFSSITTLLQNIPDYRQPVTNPVPVLEPPVPDARDWRIPGLILIGIVGLVGFFIVAGLLFNFVLSRDPSTSPADDVNETSETPDETLLPFDTPTDTPTITPLALQTNETLPTTLPSATSSNAVPTVITFPTSAPTTAGTLLPVAVGITSPTPGSTLEGTVAIFGSASHPNFVQYTLEYGPSPNPTNLWFPITSVAITTPVINNALGAWNTTTVPDGDYQVRLHVWLNTDDEDFRVVSGLQVRNASAQ